MPTELYFLGAGKPLYGDRPAALKNLVNNTRALDWQLDSFSDAVEEKNIFFLGGYQVDEVLELYPHLNFSISPSWQSRSAFDTLLGAPLSGDSAYITYSDTLFGKNFIDNLPIDEADVVVVIDSLWKERYRDRTSEDIEEAETLFFQNEEVEFTGLLYLSKQGLEILKEAQQDESKKSIGESFQDFFGLLERTGIDIRYVDVRGDWAEFNSTEDITNFILGTKAETLSRLENIVTLSHIGAQVIFTVEEWVSSPMDLISKIQEKFGDTKLVVRSSSTSEDNWSTSNAGGFESVLDVPSNDDSEISSSIEAVVNSYGASVKKTDQILIQEFLQNAAMAGVVFTCSIENGAPYYRFNFDDSSKSTESVTAGTKADLRTVIVNKEKSELISSFEPSLTRVMAAIKEIEELLTFDKLDIEFAVDTAERVHIFQVRPIVVNHESYDIDPIKISDSLHKSVDRFLDLQVQLPQICGARTIFANMPDWNPAEIVGVRPKPLAFSLYQYLVTNDIWALQRSEFGYKDVSPSPLISSFCGQPYVDVRSTLNSFLPALLKKDSSHRIVNAYIQILDNNRHFHDKIEFDVAFTVWVPSFDRLAKNRLSPFGVLDEDIVQLGKELRKITKNALSRLERDVEPVSELEDRRSLILASDARQIDKAFFLLNDCKKFGTLPFAHAARGGFVAKVLLDSLVDDGFISRERVLEFMSSFDTVAGQFEIDKRKFLKGEIQRDDLIDNYGHLRPGTYEIAAEAYWEKPEIYILPSDKGLAPSDELEDFDFNEGEIKGIKILLEKLGSDLSSSDFIEYAIRATQERELVKFQFTKNLSAALDLISEFAALNGISKDDSSYFTYSDIEALKLNTLDLEVLRLNIAERKNAHKLTKVIDLPSLIASKDDFFCFERHGMLPNFIGVDSVVADVADIRNKDVELSGKIVVISQADPGYDWLFGHDISGLVTQYGGANSHMAIRSAEIGLPAAIGVGEKLYEQLIQAERLELDCLGHRIRVVS